MIKVYYIIKVEYLCEDMLSASIKSSKNQNISKSDLMTFEKNLRKITDTTDSDQVYAILKFEENFAKPMKSYHYYTKDELKTVLGEARWAHNA